MAVPLLELVTQNKKFLDSFMDDFREFMLSGKYILGEQVDLFEEKFAKHLGVKHAIGVSSGTDALVLAMMALDIKAGDEVLCPAFTFFATAGCVSRVGATPVFVDVLPDTYNIDLEDAAKKVNSKTKAIIPVHLFGQSCDMDATMSFAKEHSLHVVEDSAQSLGAKFGDRFSGTIGDFGCYSFFPSKNLGSIGDAGLLVTQNDELAKAARILRLHGSEPKYYHKWVGGNFRIDALHALFLAKKLDFLESYEAAREKNVSFYRSEFLKYDFVGENKCKDCLELTSEKKLLLPVDLGFGKHVWNQFTLRVGANKRDELWDSLKKANIGAEVYYPVTLNQQECFKDLKPVSCPVSEKLAAEVLSIPVYPELEEVQLQEVVDHIVQFFS